MSVKHVNCEKENFDKKEFIIDRYDNLIGKSSYKMLVLSNEFTYAEIENLKRCGNITFDVISISTCEPDYLSSIFEDKYVILIDVGRISHKLYNALLLKAINCTDKYFIFIDEGKANSISENNYKIRKENKIMRTNITEITKTYVAKLEEGIYKNLKTRVVLNAKKAKRGNASINIYIEVSKDKFMSATMYIIERKDYTIVLFANDNTHDIIFNNNSADSIMKSTSYIDNYIYRCTCKMLNIPIEDNLTTKKDK